MWIRSAFWLGSVKPGQDESFRFRVDHSLMPGMRALPGVRSVKALWPRKREENPPDIACQIIVEFDTRADVELMLASTARAALRPQVLEAKAMFNGHLSHIDYEVGEANGS